MSNFRRKSRAFAKKHPQAAQIICIAVFPFVWFLLLIPLMVAGTLVNAFLAGVIELLEQGKTSCETAFGIVREFIKARGKPYRD